jgi:hypothetical protein
VVVAGGRVRRARVVLGSGPGRSGGWRSPGSSRPGHARRGAEGRGGRHGGEAAGGKGLARRPPPGDARRVPPRRGVGRRACPQGGRLAPRSPRHRAGQRAGRASDRSVGSDLRVVGGDRRRGGGVAGRGRSSPRVAVGPGTGPAPARSARRPSGTGGPDPGSGGSRVRRCPGPPSHRRGDHRDDVSPARPLDQIRWCGRPSRSARSWVGPSPDCSPHARPAC